MTSPTARSETPLRPVEFYILLGLVEGELHGYGIIQRTEQQSQGRIRLDPGTLYRAIRRLREGGLVDHAARRATDDLEDGRQRRYYQLTSAGRDVAEREARRIANLARDAINAGLIDRAELG